MDIYDQKIAYYLAMHPLLDSHGRAHAEALVERTRLQKQVDSAIATGDHSWGTANFDWFDVRDILAEGNH